MPKPPTFAFGANWNRFLRHVTEDRVRSAERSLTEFMGLENLCNRSFLDVGCGSGLFSYAAFRLGATRVVSFDPDPLSVKCCAHLNRAAGSPVNWEVHQASILDTDFTSRLGPFDVVYAWGTLQHTGRMWEALRRSTELVKGGGYLYIAIYNQVEGLLGSQFWRRFKKGFNALPRSAQIVVEIATIPVYFAARGLHVRSLVGNVQNYESTRGMHWRTDLTDWLGGLPYECATVEEIFKFVRSHCGEFDLRNLKTTNSLANNWYLFQRVEP